MAKAKKRAWQAWAVVHHEQLVTVYHDEDARKDAISSLNRPAGQRAIRVTITEDPPKPKRKGG